MRVQNLKRIETWKEKRAQLTRVCFIRTLRGLLSLPPLCSHLETTAAFKGLSSAIRLVGG